MIDQRDRADHHPIEAAVGQHALHIRQVAVGNANVAPRCGHRMKTVSFINPSQRDVIDKILAHCGLSSRAPPSDARAPPVAPPIRELTYVSDLEFVGDPGPGEPVWSAD